MPTPVPIDESAIIQNVVPQSNDLLIFAIQFFGFVLFIVIVLGILFLYETRGNRLFWRGKDGILRKKRFNEKDVTPEGFIHVNKEESIFISKEISPFHLRNFFGSTNPTYFGDSKFPITLTLNYPSVDVKYPTPALVKEGINSLIMKELQTFHEKTSSTASMILVILAGLVGVFAGFALALTGILG